MLDVIARSQRGRVCEFKKDDISLNTPFVIGLEDTIRISFRNNGRLLMVGSTEVPIDQKIMIPATSPESQPIFYKDGVLVVRSVADDFVVPEGTEIVVIPNGAELRNDARKLIDTITKVRAKAGYNVLLYVSGIAEPSMLALLVYMGVDLFDDVLSRAYGFDGTGCIPEGRLVVGENLSDENAMELKNECDKITAFISSGRLRELVDQRAASSPFNVAVLRLLDKNAYEYLEETCPTVGEKFACNTTQSLMRPEVVRFRNKILTDYRKPAHKKVLVLLPCSAKKPYHTSKSHKAFASAIHTGDHDIYVHEVILTSPLGAVPREIDVFYPANSYDIPVTGEWKCQEREFIRELTKHIIGQGYDTIISHMGKTTEMISDIADMIDTVIGDPTSPASLKKLDDEIRKATKKYPRDTYSIERTESMRSILSFQLSPEAADKIMDGSHVIGKFPYWKIFRGKDQIGMLTPERQMVSFTIEGASVLAENGISVVEMTEFELKGNVFAVGVVNADEKIRFGDDVVVVTNGKVKAIGVAQMSGREMVDLKRGIAVKVRHKAK